MKCSKTILASLLFSVSVFIGCSDSTTVTSASNNNGSGATNSLSKIQTQVFDQSCSCHQTNNPDGNLDLHSGKAYSALVNHATDNSAAATRFSARVVPNQPDSSFLIAKLNGNLHTDEGERMPLGGNPLSQSSIDMIKAWIADGAKNN